MTSILGIVIALAGLIVFAYRGASVLLLAPAMAMVAVLLSPEAPLLASYTQVFMAALGQFVVLYFPLFLLGAVFGKLMEASGAARAIADGIAAALGRERAVLAVVLACAVLTYGGVSLFVVAFAVYPIAVALFRDAQVPERLIPATIALGAFTFTMTALPGTPAIQNAIPMPFFGTTPFAAPGLGLIAGAVMGVLGTLWLVRRAAAARRAGEGFRTPLPPASACDAGAGRSDDAPARPTKPLREHAQGEGYDLAEIGGAAEAAGAAAARPGFWLALAPVVAVIALNYGFATHWLPALDTRYLALPRFGATSLDALLGIWAIIAALVLAITLTVALHWRRLADLRQTLGDGANAAVLPILNTASQVGFGAVIASLAGFALIRDAVLGIAPGNPLISLSVAVNVLAGITGSASGGMSIALQTLGANYLEMGRAAGIAPQLLHRVTAIATGGLDALPHNGAVITLLAICKLTHRQSYFDILVVAVLVPLLALATVVTLGSVFGSF
ncbi:MAG: GntP family permease [Rubrivivax sp.]|nr:GntP family permease [Rubrivivax sp.]